MILERDTFVPAPLEEVFAFFSDPQNLAKITPPSLGFQIIAAPDRPIRAGDRIVYRIRVGGIFLTWVTLISEWIDGERFTDVQEKGPYRKWEHTHSFVAAEGGVRMADRVDYELPLGPLGRLFGGWFVRRQLRTIFDFRAAAIRARFGS